MSEHVKDRIQHFIDRELPEEERAVVGEHLIGCSECRVEHDRLRVGAELAAVLDGEEVPERVWARIRSELETAEQAPMSFRYQNHVIAFGIAVIAMLMFVPAFVYINQEGGNRESAEV